MKRFIKSEIFLYIVISSVLVGAFFAVYLKTEQKIDSLLDDKPVVIHDVNPEDGKDKNTTVYVTASGEKYHKDGCNYLSEKKMAVSANDAVRAGYEACAYCQP